MTNEDALHSRQIAFYEVLLTDVFSDDKNRCKPIFAKMINAVCKFVHLVLCI